MKKRVLIIILVIVLLLVLAGGGFVFAYFFTDVFKSNKEIFTKYIAKNENILEVYKDEEIKSYVEKQKNTPYTSNGTLKVDATIQDSANTELINALQNCSITFNGNTDNASKYSYKNIKANYSDTQSLTFELLESNNIYSFKIDDVINRFIGMQNSNLKEFARKMGATDKIISSIPNELDFAQMQSEFENQAKSLELFTDEEWAEIKNKYFKIINDNLTNEMFSKEKQDNSNICTLKLNKKKAYKIVSDLLTTLKEDEMILNKIKTFMQNNGNLSEEEGNNYINGLKSEIESIINSLSQDTLEDDEILRISVYSKNHKLEKTEFIIPSSNEDEYKLSLINMGNGAKIEIAYAQEVYSASLQKNKISEGIEYDFSLAKGENSLAELTIDFNGINTDQVKESVEFVIGNNLFQVIGNATNNNLDTPNAKLVYKYENNKTFNTQINKEDINDVLLLNTAPNSDSVKNLINQISVKLNQVNDQKIVAAGLQNVENPFMYYIPAVVPIGALYATTTDIKINKNLMTPIYFILANTSMIVLNSAKSAIQQVETNDAKSALTSAKDKCNLIAADVLQEYYVEIYSADSSKEYSTEELEKKIIDKIKNYDNWNIPEVRKEIEGKTVILTYINDNTSIKGELVDSKINWDEGNTNLSNMDSIAMQTYNSQWEVYAGTNRSASYVRSLVSEVIANNSHRPERTITVNNEIPTEMPTLDGSKSYTIVLSYDANGYVNGITYN